MEHTASIHTQRYVRRRVEPAFAGENVPRLAYASRVEPVPGAPFPRTAHAHPDLTEVVLMTEGAGTFLLDQRTRTAEAGDVLVYNAGVIHEEASVPENPMGLYCLGIDGLRMPGLRANALLSDEGECVFPAGERFETLRTLFALIFDSLQSDGAEAVCQYLTLAALTAVRDLAQNAPPPAPVEPDALGRRIKDYLDTHYREPLTLQAMADALRMSPYYLSHVFRKRYGYAPRQYLTRRRIGEAQTLLLTTDLPVGRIAEMVGYETQARFDERFVKYTGMPPLRYRQSGAKPSGGGAP